MSTGPYLYHVKLVNPFALLIVDLKRVVEVVTTGRRKFKYQL